jgi:hypothetical protein
MAYGDSITAGFELPDPSTEEYPALVAADESVPFTDRAIPGDEACDIPTSQIFANADDPGLSPQVISSVLIGTNDVDYKGDGAYEQVFIQCHLATLSWLGIPAGNKVLGNSPGVQTSGPVALDKTNNWNAWTTYGPGASISFPITTTQAGAIYAWPRLNDFNTGTYSYSLDGVVQGTANSRTTPAMATVNGVSNSLGFIRFPHVAAGKHVITFIQTSAGTYGVSVVGIGVPGSSATSGMPVVLAGTVPYQDPRTNPAPCSKGNYAPCASYTDDIEADVALLAGDGLDIRIFDTRKFMFGSLSEMYDKVHPNILGHQELSKAVESVWNEDQ